MWASDLLPVHIRCDTELTTAARTSKRLGLLVGRRGCGCRLSSKRVSRNFDRLRARRTLDYLTSLRLSNLKRLLAIRTSKNKRAQFTLSGSIKDSITGITQTRNNELLVIESFVNNTRVNVDIWKLCSHFFNSFGGGDD